MERTREIQLLRVNKSVHQAVKQGDTALESQKATGYEQLLKFNEKLHRPNVSERQRRLSKLESAIMEKAMQNEQMKKEIQKVNLQQANHNHIQQSLESASPSKK